MDRGYSWTPLILCFLSLWGGSISLLVGVPCPKQVVVEQAEVRLSDFAQRDTDHNNPSLFNIQQPGGVLRLSPQQIIEAAAQHGLALEWDEPTPSWIHVQRSCAYLTTQDIEDFINLQKQWDVSSTCFLDQQSLRIPVSPQSLKNMTLEHIEVVPHTQRFQAVIHYEVDVGAPTAEPLRVSGRIAPLVMIPVLKEPLRAGVIIHAHHLDFQKKISDQVTPHIIQNAEDLVGRVTVCALRAYQPLRFQDVKKPILIKKGQMIQATLRRDGLFLSVKVRALEEGGVGDTIKATNIDSKKDIYGIVRDAQNLDVSSSLPSSISPPLAWAPHEL